jgi:hypothetical protein
MTPSQYISQEFNKIDKRRTFGLIGFLFILAFFPVILSNSKGKQEINIHTAVLAAQDSNTIKANQTITVPPQQQIQPGSQSASTPASPQNSQITATPLTVDEAYSPQPSIWLFIVPIIITFFTILFY